MTALKIHQFPCLQDNYGVLIHDPVRGVTASIDAPAADPVRAALRETGWRLSYILTTHHHWDHTDGNLPLKTETGCVIIGPKGEAEKIPGIDTLVGDGDAFRLGGLQVQVFETPGHTLGHIAFHLPQAKVAFVGDTLFAMGCGRVTEGTMQQMWGAVSAVAALPDETLLYCGHEYTVSNAKFCRSIEPGNEALAKRMDEVTALRAAGRPTLPTRVDLEKATNVFLRVREPAVRKALGMETAEDWQVFAELRERKNRG
jgi:hydroxyacylglutathione hydrolase